MAKLISDRVIDIVTDPVRGLWFVEWIQDRLHGRKSKYHVYGRDVNGKQKFFIELNGTTSHP